MPADFMRCIDQGGKVRSKRLNKQEYIQICYLDGKSYEGEVKKYKTIKNGKKKRK